ncbi:MAG: DUF2442 domain-containing protein [bacterium]
MILNVTSAKYEGAYRIQLNFDNGESGLVDLKATIFKDNRKIFFPLREINYFKSFKIKFNTLTWDNEADFAPEFLLELLIKQREELIQEHHIS